jgi:branched-chain amino acid transport system substrate-binding protein
VRFVWSDESTDPAINATKIQVLVDQEKVELLLGGGAIPTAYALRDAAEKAKLVYIDTNATGNALTRAVAGCTPSCKSRYVFRTSASSWQLCEPLGEWVAKALPKDFFLCYEDSPYGAECAAAFSEGLGKNGGKATGRSVVPPSTADWAPVVGAIRAQPTKSVFGVFLTDDAVAFIKVWDALGMKAAGYNLYGPGPLADQQVLSLSKQSGAGIVTSQFWSSELENTETKALVDAFHKNYTDEDTGGPLTPDAYAVQMWDALVALDQALAKAKGDAKAETLIPTLESVAFNSPRGYFAFDRATHNPVQDIYIREVRASGPTAVNAVIERIANVKDPGQ